MQDKHIEVPRCCYSLACHTIQVYICAPATALVCIQHSHAVVACAVGHVRLWATCTWVDLKDADTSNHALVVLACACVPGAFCFDFWPSDNITLYLIFIVRKVSPFVWVVERGDCAYYLHELTLVWVNTHSKLPHRRVRLEYFSSLLILDRHGGIVTSSVCAIFLCFCIT